MSAVAPPIDTRYRSVTRAVVDATPRYAPLARAAEVGGFLCYTAWHEARAVKMYAARGGVHSAGELSPIRLMQSQRRADAGSPFPMRAGSPSTPLRPSRTLEPLPLQADRPSSGSDASRFARNADVNPPTVRRFFFSANGLDKRSKKLPAAHHYDVLLEDGDGTEGPNLQDEIQCRYIDFLAASAGSEMGGLSWTNPSLDDVMKVANFLDTCAPRTRLDGYPLYVILKDVLRRLLRGQIAATSQAEAELQAQVASLQSSLGAAAASHMMLKRQSEQLRGRLQTIEQQLGDLTSKESGLREKLWASTNELAQASAELAESQTELEGNGEGATAKFGGMLRQVAHTGSIAESFGLGRKDSDVLDAGDAAGSIAGINDSTIGSRGGSRENLGEDSGGNSAASGRSDSGSGVASARQEVSSASFATIGAALGAVALQSTARVGRVGTDGRAGGGNASQSASDSRSKSDADAEAGALNGVSRGFASTNRLSGTVSGVISASSFASSSKVHALQVRTLQDAVGDLPPSELNDLVGRLPPNAIESLMVSALQGAPTNDGNGAVQAGLFRALVSSGQVDAALLRDAVLSQLSAEQKLQLLHELWDEHCGPNDRATIDHLSSGIGIGPDDIARMVSDGWGDWGSRFLMSVLHRVDSDPLELLQGLMRELAPRKAAATEAVIDMADGMRDQLSDASNSVADAFSSSWGSGAVMGRDITSGLNSLVSELETQTDDANLRMKSRALKALAATLELGDSSASDAFQRVVAAGDSVGVARFLMKAVARDIAGEDLGDAEAGSKLRREDFAEFASQAFGQAETPDGMLVVDMNDQLSGFGSGVDLAGFESLVLPSNVVDGDNQTASDKSDGNTGSGGQKGSDSSTLRNVAKSNSLKMGLWLGSSGNENRRSDVCNPRGSNSGHTNDANFRANARHGREVGTQTALSGDMMGDGVRNSSTGTGLDHDRASSTNASSSSQHNSDRQPSDMQVSTAGQDGGDRSDRRESGRDRGADHRTDGCGNQIDPRSGSPSAELGHIDAAAKERGRELLVKRNKSLAFISKSLALPPGKQPKPKPSNRGLVVRQINQMFEDKVVADEIDDKENNPRTSLPEFIHEHLIAKSVAKFPALSTTPYLLHCTCMYPSLSLTLRPCGWPQIWSEKACRQKFP